MNNIGLLFVGLVVSFSAIAQTSTDSYSAWEATVGAHKGHVLATAGNLNYVNNAKFKVGVALRLNTFIAKDKKFATAPAILTSGVKGPQAMFKPDILENIDTLYVPNITTYSVNLAVFLEYSFSNNVAVGFDIDVLGFTLGNDFLVDLQEPLGDIKTVHAMPTRFNLLLVSDNDIGTLNSELYGRFKTDNSRFYGKAGVSFYFSELKTANKLWLDNNRFRYKTPLTPLVGVGYITTNSLF
ncbi:hypothetical protein N9772_05635 [Bacteroidia bacterium]|jgi:hypothetical protein|nr:hypothetical protein [Bacteroidia bacterium]